MFIAQTKTYQELSRKDKEQINVIACHAVPYVFYRGVRLEWLEYCLGSGRAGVRILVQPALYSMVCYRINFSWADTARCGLFVLEVLLNTNQTTIVPRHHEA